jgi:hypothetical protein
MFIIDLPECVTSNTRLLTDDAIVYKEIKSQSDTLELQKDIIVLEEWEKTWSMSFHPDKCNIMRVTRSKNPILFNYHLTGHQLVAEDTTKYLAVDLSHDLSWSHHIDRTTKKANSMFGFLKRNLRITNQETKSAAYFSLVRPNIEYCASIWNPNHKQSMQKLEMTQRRAARYTTNNYTTTCSVNEMLQQLKWKTLESRRTKIQLIMFYKIVNKLVDIPADHYLTPSKTRIRTTHSKKMLQYHTRTDTLKFSFFFRTIPTWNMLPATVAEAPDLVSFKRGLVSLQF